MNSAVYFSIGFVVGFVLCPVTAFYSFKIYLWWFDRKRDRILRQQLGEL